MEFFETEAGLLVYIALLLASGVLMLVLAGMGIGNRWLNGLIGLAALGYGIYLVTVFFTGGEFRVFIYAFILPVVAVVQLYKGLQERKAAQAAPLAAPAPEAPTA
jgi:hypothetical protein